MAQYQGVIPARPSIASAIGQGLAAGVDKGLQYGIELRAQALKNAIEMKQLRQMDRRLDIDEKEAGFRGMLADAQSKKALADAELDPIKKGKLQTELDIANVNLKRAIIQEKIERLTQYDKMFQEDLNTRGSLADTKVKEGTVGSRIAQSQNSAELTGTNAEQAEHNLGEARFNQPYDRAMKVFGAYSAGADLKKKYADEVQANLMNPLLVRKQQAETTDAENKVSKADATDLQSLTTYALSLSTDTATNSLVVTFRGSKFITPAQKAFVKAYDDGKMKGVQKALEEFKKNTQKPVKDPSDMTGLTYPALSQIIKNSEESALRIVDKWQPNTDNGETAANAPKAETILAADPLYVAAKEELDRRLVEDPELRKKSDAELIKALKTEKDPNRLRLLQVEGMRRHRQLLLQEGN